MAKVELNRKYGFIDKSGKIVIEPKFDGVGNFSEGLAKVKLNGKYGFIDKSGKIVIEPKFDDIRY
ncbi:WG repeat-containing protein [Campylobacter coli]|uniref:WG repeat-containing protein n=1 Tax=Campylobacter coli TaxID=195 RepID=UPI0037517B9A